MASPSIVVCRTSKHIRYGAQVFNYYDNVTCAEVESTGQEAEAASSHQFAHSGVGFVVVAAAVLELIEGYRGVELMVIGSKQVEEEVGRGGAVLSFSVLGSNQRDSSQRRTAHRALAQDICTTRYP